MRCFARSTLITNPYEGRNEPPGISTPKLFLGKGFLCRDVARAIFLKIC